VKPFAARSLAMMKNPRRMQWAGGSLLSKSFFGLRLEVILNFVRPRRALTMT